MDCTRARNPELASVPLPEDGPSKVSIDRGWRPSSSSDGNPAMLYADVAHCVDPLNDATS